MDWRVLILGLYSLGLFITLTLCIQSKNWREDPEGAFKVLLLSMMWPFFALLLTLAVLMDPPWKEVE